MFDDQYSPTDFDVLLTDVHSKDLHEDISNKLKVRYLENAEKDDAKEAIGVVYGPHNRIFVTTVVRKGNKLINVHFLVDTGSPSTYICNEVLESLGMETPDQKNPVRVHINNMQTMALQSHGHFDDINILGMDFMRTYGCVLTVDFDRGVVKLVANS